MRPLYCDSHGHGHRSIILFDPFMTTSVAREHVISDFPKKGNLKGSPLTRERRGKRDVERARSFPGSVDEIQEDTTTLKESPVATLTLPTRK